MNIKQLVTLARFHAVRTLNESAMIRLADAVSLYDQGEYTYCRIAARDSLLHSVGIFHADYQRAIR